MSPTNRIENEEQQNVFGQVSESFLLFQSKNQNQYNQQIVDQQCAKRKYRNQEKQNKYNGSKQINDSDQFLDSILFKEKQLQDDLSIQFKRFHSNANFSHVQKQPDQVQSQKRLLSKTDMNKIYTKNYRLKKKQQLQSLKEENSFLKQKVQDLSFRLKEAEIQINKLKHQDLLQPENFYSIKEELLKEMQKILSTQKTPFQQVCDLQQKYKNIVAFSNKPRLDFLNYLMSELLQNLVTDQGMYFIQCIQNKTGIWRQNDNTPLKKLDLEVQQILNGSSSEQQKNEYSFKNLFLGKEGMLLTQMRKIKILWKKLYEDYLEIINQGLRVQTLYRPLFQKTKSQNQQFVLTSLKLRFHFQKNKYRKDIRQIRQSWFKQIQQGKNQQLKVQDNHSKRRKICD